MPKKPSAIDQATHSQTRATWLATIIAAIALFVSFFSLYESRETRLSMIRDKILLCARRPMRNQQINILKSVGEAAKFGNIAVPWELVLSNTGNTTVSITEYEVFQLDTEQGQIFYSGLDRGLFSPENNQVVALPIALEAGKSIRLTAVIGLNPGNKAYAAITENMSNSQIQQPLLKIEKALAEKGLDIYDNPVVPFIMDGKTSGWKVNQQENEQIFLFKMHTARGVEVTEVSSWYDLIL